jgi:hypothetical protein
LNKWAKSVKKIYREAKSWECPGGLPFGEEEQIRIGKQHEFEEQLREVCNSYLEKESPMSTMRGRLTTYLPEMFVFVRFPEVAADVRYPI